MPPKHANLLPKILQLKSIGVRVKVIARDLGYPLHVIQNALNLASKPKLSTMMLISSVYKMWREGYSMSEIAKVPHQVIKEKDGIIYDKYVSQPRVSRLIARYLHLGKLDELRQEEIHAYARKQHKLRRLAEKGNVNVHVGRTEE